MSNLSSCMVKASLMRHVARACACLCLVQMKQLCTLGMRAVPNYTQQLHRIMQHGLEEVPAPCSPAAWAHTTAAQGLPGEAAAGTRPSYLSDVASAAQDSGCAHPSCAR